MRHIKGYKKLGRESSHRRAMLRNMATSFLTTGKIKTTITRAKELKPIVEKLITLGKKGNLHSRRRLESYLFGNDAAALVCNDIAKRFSTRNGGYTRIIKLGERFGDGAFMCNLELVDYREVNNEKKLDANKEKKSVNTSSKD